MFDNGVNPRKGGVLSDGSNIREELCGIVYVSIMPSPLPSRAIPASPELCAGLTVLYILPWKTKMCLYS